MTSYCFNIKDFVSKRSTYKLAKSVPGKSEKSWKFFPKNARAPCLEALASIQECVLPQ